MSHSRRTRAKIALQRHIAPTTPLPRRSARQRTSTTPQKDAYSPRSNHAGHSAPRSNDLSPVINKSNPYTPVSGTRTNGWNAGTRRSSPRFCISSSPPSRSSPENVIRELRRSRRRSLQTEDFLLSVSSFHDNNGIHGSAKDNFEGLFIGSQNIQVDPECCIPLVKVRTICKSGVARLAAAFEGRGGVPGHSKGHSSAGGLPVLVQLPEDMLDEVVRYLMERRNVTKAEAKAKVEKNRTWYGIVDGAHRHAALIILIETKPGSYEGYKWWVTRINFAPMHVLKAFACSRNEYQQKEHIVDFTIYDVLTNMREVAVTLAINRGTVLQCGKRLPHGFLKDLADRYCGGKDYASDTIRQLAGVVVKLSQEVIDAIGSIVNEECPDLAKKAQAKNSNRKRIKYIDDRVFRKTINTCTLRGATKFLTSRNDVDRINALFRVKYLAQELNYKGTPREVLEKQVERAIAARLEVDKFEEMMKSSEWPRRMKVFKNNLLTTTKLDSEVERNEGNGNVLLPSAEKLYKQLFPSSALHQIQAWSRGFATPNDSSGRNSNGSDNTSDAGGATEPGSEDVQQSNVTPHEQSPQDTEESDTLGAHVDPCLQVGIQALQMRFDAFDAQSLDQGAMNSYDLILGDPGMTGCFPGDPVKGKVVIDDKSMDDFAQFSCRALVPGGHLFLFTTTEYYHRWDQVLSERGFDVMPKQFLIVRDSDQVQSTTSRRWPQAVSDIAIVARTSGDHPTGFTIDLETPYMHVPRNAHKRKFSAITNAPAPSSRLTRPKSISLIRPNERAPQVVSELITTFCPPRGRVLDPFASVFTTGIACMATERTCVLLETDPECFELAKKRLDVLAKTFIQEGALSTEQLNRKRKRAMTTPEEVESLKKMLQELERTSLDEYIGVDEEFMAVRDHISDGLDISYPADGGDDEGNAHQV